MKKNKKLLLVLGTVASIAAPIAAVVSCGSSANNVDYGDNWALGSHRDVVTYLATKDGNNPWSGRSSELIAPQAGISETVLGEERNATQVGLFRKEKLGYDSFKKETTQGPHGPETKIISSPNRETVLKFELADKVTFKFKTKKNPATDAEKTGALTNIDPNGDIVFDSDSADSSDDKSINGDHFKEILLAGKFVRIQFHISDEAQKHHWVKQLTGEKGAAFSADDIWAGIQYVINTNGQSRFAKGGSTELDSWINKESGLASDIFTGPEPSTPKAFYDSSEVSLGIFDDQFDTANKANVVPDKSTFNLNFNGTANGNQLVSFWDVMFKAGGGIKAISSEEVADAVKTVAIPSTTFKTAADQTAFEKSDAFKSGAYQLNYKNFKDHYVGGVYYVQSNDPKKFTVKINEDYVNQVYINEKNKEGKRTHLNTYTTQFLAQSDLVETTEANAFKQGLSVDAGIKGFSKQEMINGMADPDKYGLHFSAGYTSGATVGDYTTQQLVPFLSSAKILDKDGKTPIPNPRNGKVFYNNNYAKVLWGADIRALKAGKNPENAFKTMFDGTGFEFRTAIQSAINAFTAQKEAQKGTQEWTSWFAPEGPIPNHDGGDDFFPAHVDSADTSDAAVLAALKSLTSKFTESVDKNGAITSEEHTRQSYVDIYTSDTDQASEKYSAEDVASIKKVMKDALDKAKIGSGEKVTWEFSYGRGMTSQTLNPVYEQLRKAINSLDPRLNLVAKVNPGTEDGHTEATVNTEVIGNDFSMDDQASGTHYWVSRLFAAKQGQNAGSLNIANTYEVQSPASPILANVGYLQTGVFGGLSYFAANPTLMTSANHLDGLKPIIKSLTDTLASSKTKWGAIFDALPAADQVTRDGIATIKTALASLDIKNIYKSKLTDIADYDWFGWSDLKAIGDLKDTAEGLDTSSELHAAIAKANDVINSWLSSAMYNLQSWMDDSHTKSVDIINTMIAYNIIAPWSTNPLDATLGDRENPGTVFKKNWYTNGGDSEGVSSVDYYRVDLDKGE